jgi:hypothetical protein
VAAAQRGTAFVRLRRKDLDWIFSTQHERTVNNDNTVALVFAAARREDYSPHP